MSWSFKLITVAGIPIRVHASFLIILAWAAWLGFNNSNGRSAWASVGFMVLFTLLLFLCVILHELGHSLAAQAVGAKVHDITLWPIGGVARLSAMPRRPLHEFVITAAGPAVNVVLTVVLAGVAAAWIGPNRLASMFATGRGLTRLLQAQSGQSLVLLLALQNAILVVFNLIPAFPMDGGRLLRSVLAGFVSFRAATRLASWIGQGVAVALIGLSFIPPGNFFLTLIGGFVFIGAWQERSQVMMSESLRGLTVRDAMQPLGYRLTRSDRLGDIVERVAASPQTVFAVVEDGRLAGLITRSALLAAAKQARNAATVGAHLPATTLKMAPDLPLLDAQEQLQLNPAAVAIENGVAVGLISRVDIGRLAEALESVRRKRL
jgi:Zn-dependent protease/CBS domain-containing protein